MALAVAPHPILGALHRNRSMILPAAVTGLLLVILVPLPAPVVDFLLIFNMTMSVVILVGTLYVRSPLELAVFPSLLLATTLMRLVLNVAVTRLILTAGPAGPQALHSAGEVVLTFANFVAGGSLAVGVVIFLIIVVIQFLVITKGAGRISEVAARFTLDAMPGKQMAIDADLNAGSITDKEARQRRAEIAHEADFYGAMDGASKFVRGDAIAAIVIICVNIVGGLYVGMMERHWPLAACVGLFTRLTIGDGLVSQIPALVVSLAAGLIVTRASGRGELGEELLTQVLAKPKALIIAAAFLGLMMLTGMPKAPLLVLGGCCGGLAYLLNKKAADEEEQRRLQAATPAPAEETKVETLLDLEAVEVEVGYGLEKLGSGDLLERLGVVRRQVASDLGIIVPPIRIRDNAELSANDYVINLKGQAVARGVAYPEQLLAVDEGATTGAITGATTTMDAASGRAACWITESQRIEAQDLGYALVEAPAVVMKHLDQVVRSHADELLTRQEVRKLLDNLKTRAPALVEEVVPAQLKPGELQKIMQNLLREGVPVRDLETILETAGDWASRSRDPEVLSECVRGALARTICKQRVDDEDRLWCVTVDPALEDLIQSHAEKVMAAQTQKRIAACVAARVTELTEAGHRATVLCSPQVRRALRRMIEGTQPGTAVLAYNEVSGSVTVESVGVASLDD